MKREDPNNTITLPGRKKSRQDQQEGFVVVEEEVVDGLGQAMSEISYSTKPEYLTRIHPDIMRLGIMICVAVSFLTIVILAFWSVGGNREQVFQLIDRLLPMVERLFTLVAAFYFGRLTRS